MEDTYASCCAIPKKTPSRKLPVWATRKHLMLLGGAVVVGGMAFNWSWLTAIGVAPILLALAPCGIICAFGFCAMGMKNTPAAPTASPDKPVN